VLLLSHAAQQPLLFWSREIIVGAVEAVQERLTLMTLQELLDSSRKQLTARDSLLPGESIGPLEQGLWK